MKKILVVGASGGIGNGVAKLLISHEYQVIGTYFKHRENILNLQSMKNFSAERIDLQRIDAIKMLSKKLDDDGGELFGIINCAGIVRFEGKSLDDDLTKWTETIAVNLSGNFFLAKVLADQLSQNGRIIMISSTDAQFGGAVTTSYAASKAGVDSLVKSLSLSMQNKHIRVNAIAPGWVETPMTMLSGEEYLKKVASINPLGRNAQPRDVANLVHFLLSEESDYINGQIIPIEGGYTNQDPTLLLEEKIQNQ